MNNKPSLPPSDPTKPTMDDVPQPMLLVLGMAAVMWAVEILDLIPGTSFDSWGIEPRTFRGVVGIPLAPFLHDGFGHLIGNTIPFIILGVIIALGGTIRWLQVTAIVALSAGLGTWLLGGSGTEHIGASGVVFGYLSYLIVRGFVAKRTSWIIAGIVIAMLYGGALWSLIPRPGVSFSGHLFGATGGVAAAYILHGNRSVKP